jgi:5-hydroxyisourate hydrolase
MISTHILDTQVGNPASNVSVSLSIKSEAGTWSEIQTSKTNDDGRIVFDCESKPGVYQLNFIVEEYFERTGNEYFFTEAPVIFKVTNTDRKYHVPLLLNSFGYATYRGS